MDRACVSIFAVAIVVGFAFRAAPQEPPGEARPPVGRGRPWPLHDPSTIVKHEGEYWVFSMGHGVPSARSKNLIAWTAGPAAFAQPPNWIADVVPSNRGYFWAPDVIRHDGRYLRPGRDELVAGLQPGTRLDGGGQGAGPQRPFHSGTASMVKA